jgi:hypothetical protein
MRCYICNKEFKAITNTHLKSHKISPKEYEKEFGCKTVPSGWCAGEKNSFYGKTHEVGKSKVKTEEYRKNLSNQRKNKTYIEKYGIETANKMKLERSERFKGEKNPMYVGDNVKHYPIKFFGLRKEIRNRDENKCAVCRTEEDLCVHHIDYIKKNCDALNLITLCKSCNVIVNFNRAYWTYFFTLLNGFKHGNQQPSQLNVENKVDWKVQRLIGEDSTTNKPNTSAGHPLGMMI